MKDLELKVVRENAVERTTRMMQNMSEGRKNQARSFFNRVKKRAAKRRIEKATRRKMRPR